MTKKTSALHSEYIIDGIKMPLTPFSLIKECYSSENKSTLNETDYTPIVDETIEYILQQGDYSSIDIKSVLKKSIAKIKECNSTEISINHSHSATKRILAMHIIDSIWKEGIFNLDSLSLNINWLWNPYKIGNRAAFYFSVEACSQYLFDLGVTISNFSYEETEGNCNISITTSINNVEKYSNIYDEEEIEWDNNIYLKDKLHCPNRAINIKDSLFIYIPFDTCTPKLGDSILEEISNNSSEKAPNITDTAYFIDSFEVVRELVEDEIILAGRTVGKGGLICALRLFTEGLGVDLDSSELLSSRTNCDITRELFSEIPGVIFQIKDSDIDYLDSQLILQEIAYFQIGSINENHTEIAIIEKRKSIITNILESLLNEQTIEEEEHDLL